MLRSFWLANCRYVFDDTSMSWQSKISKNCHYFLLRSIFKLVFLSHYNFKFLHQELSPINNTCTGLLSWKTIDFVRCNRIPTFESFQKNLLTIRFLDIQTHLPLSPITTSFMSSIRVSMKSLLDVKTFSIVILPILVLVLEYWSSNFLNNARYSVSFWYWNS